MVRLIFLVSLSLFSYASLAKQVPVLGVVISFDCVHCKKVYELKNYLKQVCRSSTKDPLCSLEFLPYISNVDDKRASLFYAARSFGAEEDVANIIFELSVGDNYGIPELTGVMDSYSYNFEWEKEITETRLLDSWSSIKRLSKLVVDHNLTDYPSFFWFENNEATLIPVSIEPENRIKEVIEWIRRK